MKLYYVKWDIELDAENPQKAAEKALEIMRDPDSTATVFEVSEEGSSDVVTIDVLGDLEY